jgi:hypothetical protein
MSARHALFVVHDWGTGHGSRDLVLIRALLDAGYRLTVLPTKESVGRFVGSIGRMRLVPHVRARSRGSVGSRRQGENR